MEAIRNDDRPKVRTKRYALVDKALDDSHLRDLVENRALAGYAMDSSRVRQIREDVAWADARRLQPHFIASFFFEAFRLLGGTTHEREPKRYEVKHVPAVIRHHDRAIGRGELALQSTNASP